MIVGHFVKVTYTLYCRLVFKFVLTKIETHPIKLFFKEVNM